MKNITKSIPLLNIPDVPLTGITQEHLPLADIVKDIALMKDGGAAIVLESTSLNFGLLSEREQEAVVAAFAGLINSLSFSIQILIKTQRKDVSKYLHQIDAQIPKIQTPKLKKLMEGYKVFIADTIKKKNVLGKRFFIIIPFSPFELGLKAKSIINIKRPAQTLPYTKDYVLKKAIVSLYPKRDHLIRQAGRLGLKMRQLSAEELSLLFYETYNPNPEIFKVRKEEENETSSPTPHP